MERLTFHEFITKLENAAAWSLGKNYYSLEPKLTIFNRHGEPREYFGPDPKETAHQDCIKFQLQLEVSADHNRSFRVNGTPPEAAWMLCTDLHLSNSSMRWEPRLDGS